MVRKLEGVAAVTGRWEWTEKMEEGGTKGGKRRNGVWCMQAEDSRDLGRRIHYTTRGGVARSFFAVQRTNNRGGFFMWRHHSVL